MARLTTLWPHLSWTLVSPCPHPTGGCHSRCIPSSSSRSRVSFSVLLPSWFYSLPRLMLMSLRLRTENSLHCVMLPRQRLSHDCTELNITTLLTLSAPAPARSSSVAGSRSEECPHLKIIYTAITPHLDIKWNNLWILRLEWTKCPSSIEKLE